MDRGPISEYRHVARINETRFVSPSLLGLLSEQTSLNLKDRRVCVSVLRTLSKMHILWFWPSRPVLPIASAGGGACEISVDMDQFP